jgi:hypothetical protein
MDRLITHPLFLWLRVTSRRATLGILLCSMSATSHGASSIEVYVAYAENLHPHQFLMPNPWRGSRDTTFLGYSTTTPAPGTVLAWNTGAILIRNAGTSDVVLGPGAWVDGFTEPTISFKLWDDTHRTGGDGLLGSSGIGAAGIKIHPGKQVILAQTGASERNSSDYSSHPCSRMGPSVVAERSCSSNFDTSATPAGEVGAKSTPVIHVKLDGVWQTFTDTAQILNTSGTDPGSASTAVNQSVQWRRIGTTGRGLPGGSGVNPPAVTTWHNDNARTGLNRDETTLTPKNVDCTPGMTCTFGKLFTYPVTGQITAQPLFVPDVLINGSQHNTVFVATTNTAGSSGICTGSCGNYVYAFDAESAVPVGGGKPLWVTYLGKPMTGFNVSSTPVIDATTQTLYVVGSADGNGAVLHALDLGTGADKQPPSIIGGAVLGTGDSSCCGNPATAQINFSVVNFLPELNPPPSYLAQRPALLLHKGSVYVAFGSGSGSNEGPPYHGWLFGYSAAHIATATEIFNSTPMATSEQNPNYHDGWNVAGGGFWMGGAGPAADDAGVFATTGNGVFNAGDYGDSILRLTPPIRILPPPAGFPPLWSMTVADSFTPSNQLEMAENDSDFGASGPLLVPHSSPPLLIEASKDGSIYVLHRGAMGTPAQLIPGAIGCPQAVGGCPQTPCPVSYTAPDGWWGVFRSSPAYFNDAVYFKADCDLRAFNLQNGQLATSPIVAPSIDNPLAIPTQSATPSISYDSGTGTSAGIVWTVENPNGDAVLNAYAASQLNLNYSSSILPSDAAGTAVSLSPPPTVTAGKVFVATTTQLVTYGEGSAFPLQTDALTVNLKVVPATNRSTFDVLIDGTLQLSGVGNHATTGALQLASGTHVVSARLASAPYGVDDQFSFSYDPDCTAGGTITLQGAGNSATCNVVAQAQSCPAGQSWNASAAKCEAPTCPDGEIWNPGTKQCACANGGTWNSATSRCQTAPTCPSGSITACPAHYFCTEPGAPSFGPPHECRCLQCTLCADNQPRCQSSGH